jgi:hypothetical protein
VRLEGNELVDEQVRHAPLNVFERPIPPVNFEGLADTGRFAHSILPRVFLRIWFEGQRKDRKIVSTVSKIMSGHCAG